MVLYECWVIPLYTIFYNVICYLKNFRHLFLYCFYPLNWTRNCDVVLEALDTGMNTSTSNVKFFRSTFAFEYNLHEFHWKHQKGTLAIIVSSKQIDGVLNFISVDILCMILLEISNGKWSTENRHWGCFSTSSCTTYK